MIENTLSLPVDVLNDANPVTEAFTKAEVYLNRSTYVGADHSQVAQNRLAFYRSLPKKNGNFRGTAKSSCKFTQDVVVTGVDGVAQLTAPSIGEVSFSFPVGTSAATVKHVRQRLIALLDDDSIMDQLNIQLLV